MVRTAFLKTTLTVVLVLFGCSSSDLNVGDGSDAGTGGVGAPDNDASGGQGTGSQGSGGGSAVGACDGLPSCDGRECTVDWTANCGSNRFGTYECSTAQGPTKGFTLSNGISVPCENTSEGALDCLQASTNAQAICGELINGSGGSSGVGGTSSTGGSNQGSGGSGGCTAFEWCLDNDGDGYTNPDTCTQACSSPGEKYRLNGGYGDDCYDENKKALPNTSYGGTNLGGTYFNEDRGDGSFDYDCDGEEIYEHRQLSSCLVVDVPDRPGWFEEQPACGDPGLLQKFLINGECDFGETVEVVTRCR